MVTRNKGLCRLQILVNLEVWPVESASKASNSFVHLACMVLTRICPANIKQMTEGSSFQVLAAALRPFTHDKKVSQSTNKLHNEELERIGYVDLILTYGPLATETPGYCDQSITGCFSRCSDCELMRGGARMFPVKGLMAPAGARRIVISTLTNNIEHRRVSC